MIAFRPHLCPRPDAALVLFFLLAVPMVSQTPRRPGKLVITSTPPGASISINGRTIPQRTDTTLVAVPGDYRISVSGGPGNLNCPVQSVSVSSNSTTQLNCLSTGWSR